MRSASRRHPALTPAEKMKIRALYAQGITQLALARRFDCTPTAVAHAIHQPDLPEAEVEK